MDNDAEYYFNYNDTIYIYTWGDYCNSAFLTYSDFLMDLFLRFRKVTFLIFPLEAKISFKEGKVSLAP